MSPEQLVSFVTQMGLGGIFFYLYWDTRAELRKQNEKHDADISRLYDQRIQDLKLLARTPTNLES